MASMTSDAENKVDKARVKFLDGIAIHMEHLSFDGAAQQQNEILSSPLITVSLLNASPPPQFDLFGGSLSQSCPLSPASRVFYNITCPSSVFICGSQGLGKSNTFACLLENCLIPSKLGNLPQPLAGIVFHFDSFVATLEVFHSIYSGISQVKIDALNLSDQDLNTRRMLDLMAVGEGGMPLYLHVVNRVLRDMRLEQQRNGQDFS
ncbi:hypothetical protein QIS74_04927 [Colletotrichum tabaci]|uniref:Uncharacterized protein n=1 Tax=Colletotrichum tabaci TaxID=1209068 RepID=A0AAV9TJH6_9PEZI